MFFSGPPLISGVDFLLLIEALLIFFLSVLLGLFGCHQPVIENAAVVANLIDVIISNRFLVGQ